MWVPIDVQPHDCVSGLGQASYAQRVHEPRRPRLTRALLRRAFDYLRNAAELDRYGTCLSGTWRVSGDVLETRL